ncbi:MoaD/ThiS family protein [Rhodocaloribacter litoris]|uniref:MoaD/ThiS family protein n=1 Tax=Rhodocaloribacter litoris TaxID=2558931 RepID=UPI0014206C99|nr:MoaD/ThiS family protein [Rhodocaloribacter litoris]QXD15976.1 MoaD/ThiS family protein [Rhodocaloribacter litoris]GIV59696.1 MAG: hypothetical protein KatS3mg043_0785 [Rhodothermaceae bacterium]
MRDETIGLRVLLFSVLRERIGTGRLEIRLPAPATGEDLLDALERAYPALRPYRGTLRLAVNRAYAPETTPLNEGDEVALITPVSGG